MKCLLNRWDTKIVQEFKRNVILYKTQAQTPSAKPAPYLSFTVYAIKPFDPVLCSRCVGSVTTLWKAVLSLFKSTDREVMSKCSLKMVFKATFEAVFWLMGTAGLPTNRTCVVVRLIDTFKCPLQPSAVCVCVCVCALGLVWPEITQRAHLLFLRILVSHCLWGEQLTACNLCGKVLKMKHFPTQPRVWVCLGLRWTETYFCWNSSSRSAISISNK